MFRTAHIIIWLNTLFPFVAFTVGWQPMCVLTPVSVVMVTPLFAQTQNCSPNIDAKMPQSHNKSRGDRFLHSKWDYCHKHSECFIVPQFATVEVAITFIKDEFGPSILRFLKREELLALVVCVVCFILGIPHITKVHYITARLFYFSEIHIWGYLVAFIW